ncbi:MAG: ABC transporter permease [Planctomycetota bacterium]
MNVGFIARHLKRLDDQCQTWSDQTNAVLIKESRQALKSRQFLITFSILLLVAFGVTVAGSLMLMPGIYTEPSAKPMLYAYLATLGVPMLLIVPLSAHRSVESEIDDGTLELLSITSMSPWQIVWGKTATAVLQMMLYFVALLPCLAFAFTLRGIALDSLLLAVLMLALAGWLLVCIAIAIAPLASARRGRIATLLPLLLLLGLTEFGVGSAIVALFEREWILSPFETIHTGIAGAIASISLGIFALILAATQLQPSTENRSSLIRWSLMAVTTIGVGLAASGIYAVEAGAITLALGFITLMLIWGGATPMLAAESGVMTARISRELPQTFLERVCLTWLTPGPGTGLVFAGAHLVTICSVGRLLLFRFQELHSNDISRSDVRFVSDAMTLSASYILFYSVGAYVLIGFIRRYQSVRVEIGLAGAITLATAGVLVPYFFEGYANDFREFSYSGWQITNAPWTIIHRSMSTSMPAQIVLIWLMTGLGIALVVLSERGLFRPRRIAEPERVRQERQSV